MFRVLNLSSKIPILTLMINLVFTILNTNLLLAEEHFISEHSVESEGTSSHIRTIDIIQPDQKPFNLGDKVNINWEFVKEGVTKIARPLIRNVEIKEIGVPDKTDLIDGGRSKVKVSLSLNERQSQFFEVAKGSGTLSIEVYNPLDDTGPNDLKIIESHPYCNPYCGDKILEDNQKGNVEVDSKDGKEQYCLENGRWKMCNMNVKHQ